MKSIYTICILLVLSTFFIHAQNQQKMKQPALVIPQITPDFEKLDTLEYLQIKEKDENYGEKILSDGTIFFIEKSNEGYTYNKTLPNSYFTIVKLYYLNGIIQYKGLFFNHNEFTKGKWYEYDENGKISDKGDYDTPYKYGFEKILAFCQKEGIELKTGDIDTSSLYSPTIKRYINPETNRPEWFISNFIEADYAMRYIRIDGITGDPIQDYTISIARY